MSEGDRKNDDTSLEALARADAWMRRHRRSSAAQRTVDGVAPSTDAHGTQGAQGAEDADDDIPLLTDVALEAPKPDIPDDDTDQDAATGQVISRVQSQNLEHATYLRIMSKVDDRIANVVQDRVMPGMGSALNEALSRITNELKASLGDMVKKTVEDTLRNQPQRLAAPADGDASRIIGGPSTSTTATPPRPTMELAKSFEPAAIEARWYPEWERNGFFKAGVDGAKPGNYCILLPPPNVTGTLHMGHAFQHTLMDALTRYHRMRGMNTLWQPGTDHAGIATQIVVERQLDAQKISRHDLGRDKFTERVWQWKEESGSTITRQMRRLGSSCDWQRERFTMDEGLSHTVTETFVRMHQQGLIYRGKRLVNWDPVLQTAVSDLEVESHEEEGKLWHIRYPLAEGDGLLVVATTRPETLLGDVAVAVNPNDERYQGFIGKSVKLPLTGRVIDRRAHV